MKGPAQHPCSWDARTKRRRGVSGPSRCWSSKVGAALGTRAMGARGQQRTQSRGGRRHPILERKGGAITKPLSPRGQGQRAGSPPLVGVGGMNPNFLNPDRCWGWGRPWIARPDGTHIHRLGFGCVCWRPLSKSGSRKLDKLQSSWGRLTQALWGHTQPGGRGHQPSSPDLASGMRHGGPRPATWGRLVGALSQT